MAEKGEVRSQMLLNNKPVVLKPGQTMRIIRTIHCGEDGTVEDRGQVEELLEDDWEKGYQAGYSSAWVDWELAFDHLPMNVEGPGDVLAYIAELRRGKGDE